MYILTVRLSYIRSAIKALLSNRAVDLEFHLQQLLPAVFTCVVAAKLSSSASEVPTELQKYFIFSTL